MSVAHFASQRIFSVVSRYQVGVPHVKCYTAFVSDVLMLPAIGRYSSGTTQHEARVSLCDCGVCETGTVSDPLRFSYLDVRITCSVIDQGTRSIPCRLIPHVPHVFKLDFVPLIQVLAPLCVFPTCSFSVASVNSQYIYNPLLQPDCLHFQCYKHIYMFCPYRLTVAVVKAN